MEDLRKDAGSLINKMRVTVLLAFGVLAVTSAFLFYTLSYDFLSKEIANMIVVSVLASIIAFVVASMSDGSLPELMRFVMNEWVNRHKVTDKKRRVLRNFMTIALMLLLTFTGTISIWSRFALADATTDETGTNSEISSINSTIESNNHTYTEGLNVLNSQLAKAEKTKDERLRAAEKEKKRLIAAAIKSKGKNMATLYKNGNGWAAAQLNSEINKATKKGDELINIERSKTTDLEKQVQNYISSQGKSLTETASTLSLNQSNILKKYLDKLSVKSNIFLIIDIIALFVVVLFSWIIALYESLTNDTLDKRKKVTFKELFSKGLGKVSDSLKGGIMKRWNLEMITPDNGYYNAFAVIDNANDNVIKTVIKKPNDNATKRVITKANADNVINDNEKKTVIKKTDNVTINNVKVVEINGIAYVNYKGVDGVIKKVDKRYCRTQLAAYKNKVRKKSGNIETNKARIKEWENRIKAIERIEGKS